MCDWCAGQLANGRGQGCVCVGVCGKERRIWEREDEREAENSKKMREGKWRLVAWKEPIGVLCVCDGRLARARVLCERSGMVVSVSFPLCVCV